ncbi:MAG: hypothetical protein NTY53_27235 [Kiritimatiellaeota bacterium]|nr:hypothetical protein [Kiritimatiellota bacterium]
MNEHDEKLKERLRAWRGIEPRADFEAEVWRRVAATPTVGLDWFLALREWFGVRPALASVAALLLAIAVGIGSLTMLSQPQHTLLVINTPTLQGQTLAGTYLAMTSGGTR